MNIINKLSKVVNKLEVKETFFNYIQKYPKSKEISPIEENPSQSEIKEMLYDYKAVRGILTKTGYYLWDYSVPHSEVVSKYGLQGLKFVYTGDDEITLSEDYFMGLNNIDDISDKMYSYSDYFKNPFLSLENIELIKFEVYTENYRSGTYIYDLIDNIIRRG